MAHLFLFGFTVVAEALRDEPNREHPRLDRRAERLLHLSRPIGLQHPVQLIDVTRPPSGEAVYELGQELHGGFSTFEQVLPFEVALPTSARHGGKMCGSVFGQARDAPLWNVAGMLRFVTARYDVNTIPVEVEGRR